MVQLLLESQLLDRSYVCQANVKLATSSPANYLALLRKC